MGFLRFSLMLAVVYYHIVHPTVAGYLAVHGFFVLSGYLITQICVEIYNNGWRARALFLLNRATRIWPVYLTCLTLSLLCMLAVNGTTSYFHEAYNLPKDAWGWLLQFTIIGQSGFTPIRAPERLLPAAWSLSSEMVYYLLIGVLTARSKKITTIAFVLSVSLAAWLHLNGYTFKYFYLTVYGPAYVFYTGSMAYHWRESLKPFVKLNPWQVIALANMLLYIPCFITWPPDHPYMPLYFTGTALFALLVLNIQQRPIQRPPMRRVDELLADITYPAFLIHWAVGVVVAFYVMKSYWHTIPLFIWTLPATLIVSLLIVFGIERPVKKIRAVIRGKAAHLIKAG